MGVTRISVGLGTSRREEELYHLQSLSSHSYYFFTDRQMYSWNTWAHGVMNGLLVTSSTSLFRFSFSEAAS